MQEKLAEIVAVEGNETTEMRERAYVAVMGREKRHRVRGYGLGVIPDMVPYLQIDGSSSSHRSHGRHYAHLQSQFMELESKYQQQQEQAQVQQVQTHEQLLQTQRELAMLKQMIQSQQSTPPSQQSSQPLQQPSFQMPSYPPQMYWPQPQIYPQMPNQPQHTYPTTGLTGLLMGDTSVQETDLLNQLRASSNQSSRGSEQ
ncbi:hypothetical protein ABKV19_026062 [Rosa sericea]